MKHAKHELTSIAHRTVRLR